MRRTRDGLMPALALDHVVLLIVRRLFFPRDVIAFLSALPYLDAPLAALLWLLTSSSPFKKRWPMPAFEKVGPQHMHLALAALAAIPSIQIRTLQAFQRTLGGRYANLRAFAADWPHKIASIKEGVHHGNIVACRSLFQHCSQLGDVSIDATVFADVLPLLPSSVRHVSIHHDNADNEDGWRLAVPLQQWLSTGRKKKRVTIRCALAPDDAAAVANVLTTASSLTGLDMHSSKLADALVTSDKSLLHLTRLAISHVWVDTAMQLMARLDLSTLTSLDLQTEMDNLSTVLPLLSTMPRLQELRLSWSRLLKTPLKLANATPRLRELTLHTVLICSQDTLDELFQWTCGLQQLRSVSCSMMRLNEDNLPILQAALTHWIHTGSVTDVSLTQCSLGDEGVAMVASVLRASTSLSALARLDLGSNNIDPCTVWVLIAAMAHLSDTTVMFTSNLSAQMFTEVQAVAKSRFGVQVHHQRGQYYELYRPRG